MILKLPQHRALIAMGGMADRRLPLGNKAERPWPANVIHKKDAVASHSMRRFMPGGRERLYVSRVDRHPRFAKRFSAIPVDTLFRPLP